LRPIVVSYADIPRVTDLDVARNAPELAVLSVLAHPEVEIAEVAIAAISDLGEGARRVYLDLVLTALPDAARLILEARMIKDYVYTSDFALRHHRQGREEGRKEGREEGLRLAALEVARAKIHDVSTADEARLDAVHDATALTKLIVDLGRATDATEARAMLERFGKPTE
jgi:hypothetical protein